MKFQDIKIKDAEFFIKRDVEFNITGLATKTYAEHDRVLSYVESEKYIPVLLRNKNIVAAVCPLKVAEVLSKEFDGGICVAEQTRTMFFKIHNYLAAETEMFGSVKPTVISPKANIHPTAIIADRNVIIGDNVTIGAYVTVNENTEIGDNTLIMEHCVVGSPGFYYFGEDSERTLVKAAGGVKIGSNVTLHPGTTIENGVFGKNTVIEDNIKIDNHVLISHDCVIKRNTLIAGGVTLAGHVVVGENTFLGMGSVAVPMMTIGKNVLISAGSVVTKNVPDDVHYSGNFAIEHDLFINSLKNKITRI